MWRGSFGRQGVNGRVVTYQLAARAVVRAQSRFKLADFFTFFDISSIGKA
jgi:hypothetical protein